MKAIKPVRVHLMNDEDLEYMLEIIDSNIESAKRAKEEAEGILFSQRRLKENIERMLMYE